MKRIFLVLMILALPIQAQAVPWKKAAIVLATLASVYPLFKRAYTWNNNRLNRAQLISTLDDVDPAIKQVVDQRLKDQKYNSTGTIAIKAHESDDEMLTVHALLDSCIAFSKHYENRIKTLLQKPSLDTEEQMALESLMFSLDHEMFHIQDQHAKKSIYMNVFIPLATEILTLPILAKLSTKKTALFVTALLASIFAKRIINKNLDTLYTRYQEHCAETWAINKNNKSDSLQKYIIRKEFSMLNCLLQLAIEQSQHGKTRSKVFQILTKLFNKAPFGFDVQRFDTDDDYYKQCCQRIYDFQKKLASQRYQWPLVLLFYELDPDHTYCSDLAQAKNRLTQLEKVSSNASK